MSTILKALDKLEREKAALRATGPIPVLSDPAPVRSGPVGWFLRPWFLLVLVGFLIVVLGGTAWYFYRQSRSYAPRLAERSDANIDLPAARQPAEAHIQASPPTPDATRPEFRPPERPSHPGRRQTPSPAREKPAMRQQTPAGESAGHLDSSAIQRPTTETAPADEIPATMKESEKVETLPAGPPVQTDAAAKRNAPADAYEDTPLLTDGRLRVHAIAWAPEPAERMTVINSRVLHEGDSVEDFTVVAIRPDDVVVREKGKGVWRVEFGRP